MSNLKIHDNCCLLWTFASVAVEVDAAEDEEEDGQDGEDTDQGDLQGVQKRPENKSIGS